MSLHSLRGGLLATGVAIALSACGGDNDGASPETVTVVQTQERATVTEQAAPEQDPAGSDEGGNIKVPNVVGMDHQLAQDTMQAAGLYNLSEEDATGQDRALLFDRNWTVVEQEPAAGTTVTADQTIVLRSKKDGE